MPAAPKKKPTKKPAAPKPSARTRALVLVETPEKQRTLQEILPARYSVKVCTSPLEDLPRTRLGVDIAGGYALEYVVARGRQKRLAELTSMAKGRAVVYLAFDPDGEGEALSVSIGEALIERGLRVERLRLHALDLRAFDEAILGAGASDPRAGTAWQTRRVLQRLVDDAVTPILSSQVQRGVTAERSHALAVALIVAREAEIAQAEATRHTEIEVEVEGGPRLRLARAAGTAAIHSGAPIPEAAELATLELTSVVRSEQRWSPSPPFSLSTLLVEAARQLRIPAARTLSLAQRLYEGVELGDGPVALVSFPRTQALVVPDGAREEAIAYVARRYGEDHLGAPTSPRGMPGAAQAIFPLSVSEEPARLRERLERVAQGNREVLRDTIELLGLYALIWSRFVGSHMAPAVIERIDIEARAAGHVLTAARHRLAFAGHRDITTERDPCRLEEAALSWERGDRLKVRSIVQVRQLTPLRRYSEASLLEALMTRGLAHPVEAAPALDALARQGLIERREGRLVPARSAIQLDAVLRAHFPSLTDEALAASLEADLDALAAGPGAAAALLERVHAPLVLAAVRAAQALPEARPAPMATAFRCDQCGAPLVVRWGRNGEFLACSGFPACKHGKEFTRDDAGEIVPKQEPTTEEHCTSCGRLMAIKRGRYGAFLACTGYPACKATRPLPLGVPCPRCGDPLVEKRSRRGKIFFGCAGYKKTGCDFVSWDRPVPRPCPRCAAPFLVKQEARATIRLRCLSCPHAEACDPESV